MNWADYVVIAVLALSVLMGLWRGFISEVLALVWWALAFWVAWSFAPVLAEHFSESIATPSVRIILAYIVCFVAVLTAAAIVNFVLRKLIAGSGLSGTDRLLGMLFGFVRGWVLVVLLVFLCGFSPFSQDDWWHESRLIPSFERVAASVTQRLPESVARYLQPAAELVRPVVGELIGPMVPALADPEPSSSQ